MSTDFRALCDELANTLERAQKALRFEGGCSDATDSKRRALIDRARAALAQPEPEVGEPVKQIAQIVYERAMMAAADAASRPHWPSWAELPESDARTHAMATAQAILTSCGYYTESETETAERPAVTLRTLLHPGFEPGDGSADGAQLVDGHWHVPVMGCDSLQIAVDNARAALDRPKPNRLADALARIREVSEQANTSFRPFANLLDGVFSQSEAMEPSDEELLGMARSADLLLADGTTGYREDADVSELVVKLARAVLARYGHQPAPPAEAEQRHPTPVPVSERLPGPEDCDEEGLCWWFSPADPSAGTFGVAACWVLRKHEPEDDFRTHWLPSTALPLPAVEMEE